MIAHNEPQFLPVIFQSIPHGIFTIDSHNRITAFNHAAEKITGYQAAEAIGKRCHDIFRADICRQDCPLQQSVRTMKKIEDREVTILNKEGKKLVISICTAAMTDEAGAVLGGVEMFRDLSQVIELRKRLEKSYVFEGIVSKNLQMQKIKERLPLFAASPSTVLIEGESGTGKDLVARAIHNLSPRSKGPFVTVNCSALPDNLLESELFGYVRGAFTDAKKNKPGRFQLAHNGSILLDEIGEISPAMQVKLLRVLQQREFEPLGATETLKVDVRVIAATNKNLAEAVEKNQFRDDLYYRLNVIRIQIPSLSQRREDIPLLVNHFIDHFNHLQGKSIRKISESALAALMTAALPGNIRELENAIEYAFVICQNDIIELHHLPPQYSEITGQSQNVSKAVLFDSAERDVIRSVLERNRGNRSKSARELGISRQTLWRKMNRLGLIE
jgi:PAS domain S-box-containing protein